MTTFVALGDSITLGIGDPVRQEGERRRGGRAWRGWAALLAGGLIEPQLHMLASCGAGHRCRA
jgi:lysophospholipase L1-like esterase